MFKKLIFHYKPLYRLLSKKNKGIFYSIIIRFCPANNTLYNLFLWITRIDFRINIKEKFIYHNKLKVYFSYLKRNSFYTSGIQNRWNQLIDEYLINKISFKANDLVIDCGANIGEFTMALNQINPKLNFICVEPEKKEFSILEKNLLKINSINLNIALSNTIGQVEFFKKNLNGDSSLFYIEGSEKTLVKTTTLNTLFDEYNLEICRLLKLEAEGAEPEILLGSIKILKKINFISVDCGPERGVNQEKTITSVSNILYSNNFELIDIHYSRNVLLFKNKFSF
jgi:FkbM family methyltransferase